MDFAKLDSPVEIVAFFKSLAPQKAQALFGWQTLPCLATFVKNLPQVSQEGVRAFFCMYSFSKEDFKLVIPHLSSEQWLAIYELLTEEQKDFVYLHSTTEQLLSCILFYREQWDEGKIDHMKVTQTLIQKLFSQLPQIKRCQKEFTYFDFFPEPIYRLLMVVLYLNNFVEEIRLNLVYNKQDEKILLDELTNISDFDGHLPCTHRFLAKVITKQQWEEDKEVDTELTQDVLVIFKKSLAKMAVMVTSEVVMDELVLFKRLACLTAMADHLKCLKMNHPYLEVLHELSEAFHDIFDQIKTYGDRLERNSQGKYENDQEFIHCLESVYNKVRLDIDGLPKNVNELETITGNPTLFESVKQHCLVSSKFQEAVKALYQEIDDVYQEVGECHLPSARLLQGV